MTETRQLEAVDTSSTNMFLGEEGKDFEFSLLNICTDFAECRAFNDIEELNTWLRKYA